MTNSKNDIVRLMKFFFEAGTLRKVARSHRQTLLTDDLSDNIASHSFRTAIIAYFLAKSEKADPFKALLMALFHDITEARSGDQNWVHKSYIKVFEDEILKDQLKDIVSDNEVYKICSEYEERKSKEARIAKDADLLDQIYLLKEYSHEGNAEALNWLKSKAQYKLLFSKSAKAIARKAYSVEIHCWWNDIWTEKRR